MSVRVGDVGNRSSNLMRLEEAGVRIELFGILKRRQWNFHIVRNFLWKEMRETLHEKYLKTLEHLVKNIIKTITFRFQVQ